MSEYHAKRLAADIKRISQSAEICEENKTTIFKFLDFMRANGVSPGTLRSILWALSVIAIFLSKPFQQATKDDIISVVGKIEEKYKSEKSKKHLKAELRRFYKWLRGTKDYPEEVAWIRLNYKIDSVSRKLPEEILTEEEIESIANAALNPRDKALVLILYESGCRIGEILSLKIKNVQFDEYGCVLLVNGKTGPRRVRVIKYAKVLMDWLDKHPLKHDVEAPVWVSLGTNTKNKLISYVEVECVLNKLAKKAGITKKVNPHAFRHARATHLARHLPEAIMKEHFGWTKDSRMASVYYHLSGRDVDEALLKVYGYKPKDGEVKSIPLRICPNCGEINTVLTHFCKKCNAFLDLSLAWKEKDEAVAKVLEVLKQDEWFVKRVKEIIEDLKLGKEFEDV
jgi:integrase